MRVCGTVPSVRVPCEDDVGWVSLTLTGKSPDGFLFLFGFVSDRFILHPIRSFFLLCSGGLTSSPAGHHRDITIEQRDDLSESESDVLSLDPGNDHGDLFFFFILGSL